MDFCSAAAGLWNADLYMGIGKLEKISVSRNHRYLQTGILCLLCHRTEDIIRLIAFLCKDRDLHGGKHFFDKGNLLMQLLRHRLSRSLILLKHIVAEGRSLKIEGNGQVGGLLLVHQLKKDV